MNLLHDLDPATLQPLAELDALIAEKWMGWIWDTGQGVGHRTGWVVELKAGNLGRKNWSPFTNPAHAGEARRKAFSWRLQLQYSENDELGIGCRLWADPDTFYDGFCLLGKTNGDKAAAEALATCRVIVAMLQAAEAAGGEGKCSSQ